MKVEDGLPQEANAVIQFPSGGVSRYDGAFWWINGKGYTPGGMMKELGEVPYVLLTPATEDYTEARNKGREAGIREVYDELRGMFHSVKDEHNDCEHTYMDGIDSSMKETWSMLREFGYDADEDEEPEEEE